MTHILVFGHSIAQGYWDTEGGWVQRLRKHLDEKYLEKHEEQYDEYYYEVFNLGVSGEDVGEILKRFKREAEPRIRNREDIVILHLGKNDIHRLPDGNHRKEIDSFRRELRELLLEAEKKVENILVVGEGYVGDIDYSPGSKREVSDSRLRKFEEAKKEICQQRDIPLIELRSEHTRDEWEENLEDGFHPDNEGHRIIFRQVKNRLEEEELI